MDCIEVKEKQLLNKLMARLISKWKRIKLLRQQVTKQRRLEKHKIHVKTFQANLCLLTFLTKTGVENFIVFQFKPDNLRSVQS